MREAGVILDPWQDLVFRGACLRRDGIWAAKQVGLCCPRQNGKNAILEARQLAGLFIFNERLQRYTAHLTDTAAVAFGRLRELIESVPWLESEVHNFWRANGKEAIELKNGNTIQFRTRTDRSGRGPSPNTIYFDEAMELGEASVTASIPSVAAKSMSAAPPQLWYTGSSVDQLQHDGLVFTRIREQGLAKNHETAWFEWSVDAPSPEEVPNADSPAQWAVANPGMNIRISEEHIAFELSSPIGLRGFCVERLGVGDWFDLSGAGSVISLDKWLSLVDKHSKIVEKTIFAVDVSPSRTRATICAAGLREDGLRHVETVETGAGTGWIVPKLKDLQQKHRPIAILCDSVGPVSSLVPELEQAGVEITTVNSTEHGQACGMLYDAVDQATLRHLGTPEMTSAIKGAAQRPLGESWAWSRKNSSVDITPLVAATLAHWAISKHVEGEILVAYR